MIKVTYDLRNRDVNDSSRVGQFDQGLGNVGGQDGTNVNSGTWFIGRILPSNC